MRGLVEADLADCADFDRDLCRKFSFDFLQNLQMLPLASDADNIYIASCKPLSLEHLEEIQNVFRDKFIKNVLSDSYAIERHLNALRIEDRLEKLSLKLKQELAQNAKEDEQSCVSVIFDFILTEALALNSSDIHIEMRAHDTLVRFRIDGILSFFCVLEEEVCRALIFHIKFLAHLNVAESRKAQDGSFERNFKDCQYDFRISTLPILWGESVVIRILKHDIALLDLDGLCLDSFHLHLLKSKIALPHGMILITGPTGSGKSTTLYACLNALKSIEKKIITAEDPIEYKLPLIQQIMLNSKAGLDFSNALRAILRQDPDIIMIGEIRDEESLDIAIKSALTGHLLLSTLHTNDALSTLERLIDMGAKPYLIASALKLIIAQRLVRKLCPHCKEKSKAHTEFEGEFHTSKGCKWCNYSGFLGRELVGEFLELDEGLRELIRTKADKMQILAQARKNGFQTMLECGLEKARKGRISLEELLRVVG